MGEPKVVREGTKAIVRPEGDLVASSIPEVRTLLRGLVQEGIKELVVDCSDTIMIDSTGIGLLISAHNSISRAGGKLSVVHVSKEILDLFTTMRMNRLFTVSCG